jgi:hypothetical protein
MIYAIKKIIPIRPPTLANASYIVIFVFVDIILSLFLTKYIYNKFIGSLFI